MPSFTFENPTRIVFGPGSLIKLKKEAARLKVKKLLLVTGRKSAVQSGVLNRVISLLSQTDIQFELYSQISPNPLSGTIEEGASFFTKNHCDGVLALGGGSVMDAGKLIAFLAYHGGKVRDYFFAFGASRKSYQNSFPVITVPTLAGTGSEADPIAVVNFPETRDKKAVSNSALYPRLAIVDPKLTLTAPIPLSMEGIVDILSHVLETYFSNSIPHPIEDGFSETLAQTVLKSGTTVLSHPGNLEARTLISQASTYAMCGMLEGRKGPWPLHALEHELSGLYPEISHGNGLAALMLPLWRWSCENGAFPKLKQFAQNVLGKDIRNTDQGINIFSMEMEKMVALKTLKELGVAEKDMDLITEKVLENHGNRKGQLPNIKPMSRAEILEILREAFTGNRA
jgi:alcohol dehydrogenase YqhD (iron-dependent ADH family)